MRETPILRKPWTPPRVRLILLVSFLLFAANMFDTFATLAVTRVVGISEEENPLMYALLAMGAGWFAAAKIGAMLCMVTLLAWQSSQRRLAWIGLCAVTVIYTILVASQATLLLLVPPPGFG